MQCITAIARQTVQNLEIIAIDDGSKDATFEAINSIKTSRPFTKLKTANKGAHHAINLGLKIAKGEYLAICNSDDFFEENRLEVLVSKLEEEQRSFAFSGVRYVDEKNLDISTELPFARELKIKQNEITHYPSVGFALILSNVAISTGNFVFTRNLFERVGFFRPYRYVHDWDFILRSLLIDEPIYVPELLYNYRLHPNNSFLELQEAAGTECPELMRRFLKAVYQSKTLNKICPSPLNWPGYFDYFLKKNAYEPYQSAWEEIDEPYWQG